MPLRFGRPSTVTKGRPKANRTKVFVSFDYDNDRDLKAMLIGQSRNPRSPFEAEDWSIKEESAGWRAEARTRIRRCALVIVICGFQTHRAAGVTTELEIAREEEVPFVLLRGRKDGRVQRPAGTSWWFDQIHPWTWSELERLTRAPR